MAKYFALLGAAVAASLVLAAIGAASFSATAQSQGGADNAEKPSFLYKLNKKYHDYKDGVMKVRAGGGGHIAPLTQFFPQRAEIKAGETVTWYNPTGVSEPHTVTFIMAEDYFASPESPYLIANGTELTPANPAEKNTEPLTIPGQNGTNTIVVANARSSIPVVVGADDKATYLPLNSNYTIAGGEKYINSGWMWPDGKAPPGVPPITSFSVTFNEAGTYNYICLVHPWMTGQVIVK